MVYLCELCEFPRTLRSGDFPRKVKAIGRHHGCALHRSDEILQAMSDESHIAPLVLRIQPCWPGRSSVGSSSESARITEWFADFEYSSTPVGYVEIVVPHCC